MQQRMVTVVTPACWDCGLSTMMEVPLKGYNEWTMDGQPIVLSFPDMSDDDREMLISGTHPACWDRLFPREDEGDKR